MSLEYRLEVRNSFQGCNQSDIRKTFYSIGVEKKLMNYSLHRYENSEVGIKESEAKIDRRVSNTKGCSNTK